MYAVIELKGTQVLVEKDTVFSVNRMAQSKSKTLKVDKVLFGKKGAHYFVGEPYVKGAFVECDILADKRGKKVIAFKYRDRKSSQSKIGHRQDLTELKVKDIHFAEEAKPADKKAEIEKAKKTAAAKAKKTETKPEKA